MTLNLPPTPSLLCTLCTSCAGLLAANQICCFFSISVAEHLGKVFPVLEIYFFKIFKWHSPSGHLMFSQVSFFERCLLYLNVPSSSHNILFSITYLQRMLQYLSVPKSILCMHLFTTLESAFLIKYTLPKVRKFTCLVAYDFTSTWNIVSTQIFAE